MLLHNFKESFFHYLNLGEKVADFSEQSIQRFSLAVGAYWKHWLPISNCDNVVMSIPHAEPLVSLFLGTERSIWLEGR